MTLNKISPGRLLYIALIFIFILSSGCSKNKKVRGKDIVPKDVMINMMVEMHLIDGLTNDVSFYRKYNPHDSIDLYGSVYKEYGISREAFDATLLAYSSIPRRLDELYSEVLKELNLMQEELDRQKLEELDRLNSGNKENELPADVEMRSQRKKTRER